MNASVMLNNIGMRWEGFGLSRLIPHHRGAADERDPPPPSSSIIVNGSFASVQGSLTAAWCHVRSINMVL